MNMEDGHRRGHTDPDMKLISRLDTFKVPGRLERSSSSIISSGRIPTMGRPFKIPMVAGTPPLTLTADSRRDDNAILSGYGNPT